MLEGVVARILNQLLGKYVVDLDTENLNVGIFSGHVQLTDLKLKPETLYELKLPIEVKAGTIGKLWIQIPWTFLWNQPIIVTVEDLHIVVGPVVTHEPFDAEKNKRLLRAAKRKALEELDTESQVLGGPSSFSEHLISNILNFLQVNVTNVHIRYEDSESCKTSIAAGLCIGSINAETTNSKWKSMRYNSQFDTCFYLVNIQALSVYWNSNVSPKKWDLPSQYYQWRNSMSTSLQNYSFNNEEFDFILNPITSKIKIITNKSSAGNVTKLHVEVVVQDCNIQVSKEQYDSILGVVNSMERMLISWQFLSIRPEEKIKENQKIWWKYASYALLEQRVKPYTWSRIKKHRQSYKDYMETYKQIILNPNDTELKLDLQKYEDNLSIVNVVVARQQARLMVQAKSFGEKSFWAMLPSPERILLCEKIRYLDNDKGNDSISNIDHNYNFRLGNLNVTLINSTKEIMVLTVTQTIWSMKPNYLDDTFKFSLKIEGIILEGSTTETNTSISLISSEHLSDSPAYFFKMEIEKMPKTSVIPYKLSVAMDSVECIYDKQSVEELENFLTTEYVPTKNLLNCLEDVPLKIYDFMKNSLAEKWEISLNIKVPYFIIPKGNSYLKAKSLLIIDLGRYTINTEICQQAYLMENATQMELQENLYSKFLVRCADIQILLCDNSENWKGARKEKETEMHIIPKTHFSSIYALSVANIKTIPRFKFNVTFHTLKLNISERKIGVLFRFFNADRIRINIIQERRTPEIYMKDKINCRITSRDLREIQDCITVVDGFSQYKRYKVDNLKMRKLQKDKSLCRNHHDSNMNEAWARCVDLPGLEDNISPNNNIHVLLGFVIKEFCLVFSRSSDVADRQYLMLRLDILTMDIAIMTYGPAYQLSVNCILVTDKLHTTQSGQYLDLIHSPFPNNQDVITVLYRKVSASCPDFWTHFHGVETSLVANFGNVHLLLHQEAVQTALKYSTYLSNKLKSQISPSFKNMIHTLGKSLRNVLGPKYDTPVPPGSVKFSQSARLTDLYIMVCDSDFDIVKIQLSGFEVDFLFRANERFVFRSFLSNINVEHLSDVTLYSKVLYSDEDKVFDIKYVRNSTYLATNNDISPNMDGSFVDGSLKFQLGRINCTFLYKLIVQLQRFIINLEAMVLFEQILTKIKKLVSAATDTLKSNSKINLALNICGPVFLVPQKSSSPNVMIIDTGELKVENFFKDCGSEVVENILVKLNRVTVTRGVMTLVSTLEMQESLVEPISVNMDIKGCTNVKTSQKTWEIDSIVDNMQITLGQRDLTTIMSIYTDNIGEGKLLDLFPYDTEHRSSVVEPDETVRSLEAFFCELKQTNIVAKCTVDEVQLTLFFDSGELLSSPIRDLNHGLCKLKIVETDVSFVFYNDKSLDGKLCIDTVILEEIGPDANASQKSILHSPQDDNKNNNCNITVNKPPIVDITFHRNKTADTSVDIIIGRLSLCLSIPFCEKFALFLIECLPKEHLEVGIINAGYEADSCHKGTVCQNAYLKSLTLSLRLNKPELIFLVETTSNKKRYFITKCEILIDFFIHSNKLNLVISLSGLNSLFYDLGEYSEQPYTILKECDLELCKSYAEESGEKTTVAISSIYVKLCSKVVHSISDILNDIVEHFKVPEADKKDTKKNSQMLNDEDLWEPKNLCKYIDKRDSPECAETDNTIVVHEILLFPKFNVIVIFELEDNPVLIMKSTLELNLYDWSSLFNSTCEISLQANYFNQNTQSWEPIIDPISIDEAEYKPWEVLVKIFQDKSLPMQDIADHKTNIKINKKVVASRSAAMTEDEDSGEDMMYIEPINSFNNGNNRRVKTSLSTFLGDSDSENEDGTMENLAAAITDLFTGDWNENEDSESAQSSDGEDVEELKKNKETYDMTFNKSFYLLIDAKENFNVTLTPNFLKVINEIFTQYSNKIISVGTNKKSVSVTNDIGPQTRVELYEKHAEDNKLLSVKRYENEDSVPNSPTKSQYFVPDSPDNKYVNNNRSTSDEKEEYELAYDIETSLQFPSETTPQLYNKINKYFLKIFVPNFLPVQTNCCKRNWEKLIRLNSDESIQPYYLAAKHSIGKLGRTVTVSSPLQIRNETRFELSVLYQPSILQQLNLEPVGDITNPFETTMRIAVLEAHEVYNVPLYIAYHCKLFIQPAFAEGHYASNSGIWWKDLATELDTAHDLHCKPKSDSNLEIFSMRVMLKRNLHVKKYQTHSIPNYVIHLLPPLIIHNVLPYTLEVLNCASQKMLVKVEPGEKNCVYSLDNSKDQKLFVKIKHDSTVWSGNLNLTKHLDEKVLVLNCVDAKDNVKKLGINVKSEREGSCNVFFFAPYWIVNKTGLPLQIKDSASSSLYESRNEDILLFTFRRQGKQTLNIRVYESNWSNEFGLECAGTTGLVVCKDNERKKKYLFFLHIRLSYICPRFTKIVTILPSFLITNNTARPLRYMEHNEKTDLWEDLAPYQTVTFWPETSSMQMYVKYREGKVISQPFFISNRLRTVLRMDKGGPITVEVSGGINESFRICFNEFKAGDAPVLVQNYCTELFIKVQQEDVSTVTLVHPHNSVLYTWDEPTNPRKLVWNVYNNQGSGFFVDITNDGYGEEKIKFNSVGVKSNIEDFSSSDDSDSSANMAPSLNQKVLKDKVTIYWLCFREDLQRKLVFTQEPTTYNNILERRFKEHCHIECLVALSGVGLTLFTSENDTKEHIYAALSDMPAIWEVNVGHKWKTLTLELASWIEDKYRLQYKKCQIKEYVHIDFEKMFMMKPFFAELRRTYHPAVYVHFRKSRSHQYYNLKLQSIQIDNKQTNSIVLHPLPPQKNKDITPFAEVVVSKRYSKDLDIYRYIKFRLANLYLNIEHDLFFKLGQLVAKNNRFYEEPTALYVKDVSSIHKSVTAKANATEEMPKSVIEYLSLTGFDVQLNISKKNSMILGEDKLPLSEFLDCLFPLNMSPYMPLEGVHLRILSIENADLRDDVKKSMTRIFFEQAASQFLQQYYSHVLGLQVLVNSFAIQPAMEGGKHKTEAMANILLYGSRCILGHINMSPAAIEACVMEIFSNQNIENIRRMQRHGSYHKFEYMPRTITVSSRNFTTGVPNALSQLIVKNQNASINCDGEMFFRTTGKALLSLVLRHPDEKSDNVEIAQEALRRAFILGEPIKIQQRLTRYCNKFLGLKPISRHESMGQYLLESIGNSRFINDTYWGHAAIDKIGKSLIIVTLEHVMRINKFSLWGPWEVEWVTDLDDIISMPKINCVELILNIRQNDGNLGRVQQLKISGQKELLLWIHEKIEQAMIVSMDDKSWTPTKK